MACKADSWTQKITSYNKIWLWNQVEHQKFIWKSAITPTLVQEVLSDTRSNEKSWYRRSYEIPEDQQNQANARLETNSGQDSSKLEEAVK